MLVNHSSCGSKSHHTTLCPATDGTTYMCHGSSTTTTRKYEQTQRWQQFLQTVNLILNGLHHLRCYDIALPDLTLAVVGGKIAAHDEQRGLHIKQETAVGIVGTISD